jgi:hypothetical protein
MTMGAPPVGRRFEKGNPGKPKGIKCRRTVATLEAARAMSGHAFDRLTKLIDSRSPRIAFEASRLILSYAWGLPRQTLELSGDFGNLSAELTAALKEARARRAAFDTPLPVAAIVAAPETEVEKVETSAGTGPA